MALIPTDVVLLCYVQEFSPQLLPCRSQFWSSLCLVRLTVKLPHHLTSAHHSLQWNQAHLKLHNLPMSDSSASDSQCFTWPYNLWPCKALFALTGLFLRHVDLRDIFFKYLFYLFIMYTIFWLCVCLQAGGGHQTSLQMAVSHHVVAGNWTQDLWKNRQWS